MDAQLPCRIFSRMSRVSKSLPETERRDWLRSVFVERKNDHVWIGATDATFAAIYYVGPSHGEDGFVLIRNDDVLLNRLAQFDVDAKFRVIDTPFLNWCGLTTPDGYAPSHDVAIRDMTAISTLNKWREWLPDTLPEEPGRAMYIECDRLLKLVECCPSGQIVFPKIIDANSPIIVRDHYDPSWLGVFLARPHDGLHVKGAQIPDWI